MSSLALILVVAAIGYGLARWTRLPVIPLLLFAGLAMSALGMVPDAQFTQDAFQLGLAFLVFAAGMELNPNRFKAHLKAVFWVGFVQFSVMGACGFLVSMQLGFSPLTSAYLAIALSTSSTLVVVSHLKQQHQMFEPFARLVVGVLLVQDLLIILIVVVLSRWNEGTIAVGESLIGVIAMAGVAVGCQRWLLPWLLLKHRLDEEILLLVVLALLFGFVALTVPLGVPSVAGAFLAGFALANFPVNGVVRGLLLSLTDFFQAIFFTTLGTVIVFPEVALVAKAAVLALAVLLITPPLVAAIAEWQGLTSRPAVESGLLIAQTSEFALVLGLAGSQVLGHIQPESFSVIALVAVFTMTLTPFIATDRFTTFALRFHPLRRRIKAQHPRRGHALVLGFGAGGMWVIKPLLKNGYEVVVVDDDPVVIDQLHKLNVPCIRGDGSDEEVLDRASASSARFVLASMRRLDEAIRVLKHLKGVPVIVRVFEQQEADQVRRLGGIPVLNSTATAKAFMEWFDKTSDRLLERFAANHPVPGQPPAK